MPAHKHPEEAEPDSHFLWTTPDETTEISFTRDRAAVLQLASEWDLCISGDGLTHLQQIGHEAACIPLAQVRQLLSIFGLLLSCILVVTVLHLLCHCAEFACYCAGTVGHCTASGA